MKIYAEAHLRATSNINLMSHCACVLSALIKLIKITVIQLLRGNKRLCKGKSLIPKC